MIQYQLLCLVNRLFKNGSFFRSFLFQLTAYLMLRKKLGKQIESLRNKYESIKDYQDDFFVNMKNEIISQINVLVEERSSYQNKISTKEEYDEKIKEIVNAFKDFPNECNDIGDTDFKSLFSKGVVVNKGLIYFIIGNSDIKLPLEPKLLFKSSIEYKVRITTFTTQFGVLISK